MVTIIRMKGFFRFVAVVVALGLIAFLGACYWYGWRPLGELSGTIHEPVSAPGTISRDAIGVPHIQAATWQDAIFLQGYAMAQDRLWQMDGLRRRAAGELAEVAGAAAYPFDYEARRLGLARIAEKQEANLSAEDRAVMEAFARGVNHFIETHQDQLPLEFSLLGYAPKPWRVHDCMLAGIELYRTLTSTWRAEINKQHLLEQGDPAMVEYLFPTHIGADRQPGSNAWVISGAHTASGKPLLSNDPHLEFALPSPWYLVHLQAPDLDVTGATIVGLPGVVTGHNQKIAWGVTNLEFDVQDLYSTIVEKQSDRFLLNGKLVQAQHEQQTILVKNGKPVVLDQLITPTGAPLFEVDGKQMVLRWSAEETGGFTYPFLEVDRASNWDEFRAALKHFGGPGQNFVYADTAGNIGYQATGRLPLRKGCDGDVPADGTKNICEWNGFIPFDDLPHVYNPESGRIATANQNPFPENALYPVHGNFASPYRARQIYARLEAREQWKPEEMLSVQTDVYSAFGLFLAKQIATAAGRDQNADRRNSANFQQAVAALQSWDGRMQKEQAAPMIVMRTLARLRETVAERFSSGKNGGARLSSGDSIPTTSIEKLLYERPRDWFTNYDELLLNSLAAALLPNAVQRQFGDGQPLHLISPVAGRIPLIGSLFNLGPAPMSGAPTTVLQYTGRLGPSLRITEDLSDWERSTANLVTGESGQRLSLHYKDQWNAYMSGRSFPMQFGKVEAKEVLRVEPGQK